MKKIYIALITILIISCVERIKKYDRDCIYDILDFNTYIKKDFVFTPNIYIGKNEVKGIIEFQIIGGAEYIENSDYRYAYWRKNIPLKKELLEIAYKIAIKMDANAIQQIKIDLGIKEENTGKEILDRIILKFKGVAIKILDQKD